MSFINAENGEGTTLVYDSGVVASGAVINSGILDLRRFTQATIVCVNSDGASTRGLTFNVYPPSSTTAIGANITIGNVATGGVTQIATVGGGWTSGLGGYAGLPGFVQFTMAAAGSSNGRMMIWAR